MGVVMMILCGSPLSRQSVGLIRQPGIFPNEVAAGADTAPVGEGGGSAVAVAGDVVDVANRCVTEVVRQVWSRRRMSLASQPS